MQAFFLWKLQIKRQKMLFNTKWRVRFMQKVLFSLEKCFLFVSVVSFYKMCGIYSLKW